jgi:phage-related protein
MQFELEFYTTENGAKPAEEFIDELSVISRTKTDDAIALLQILGNQLRMPYSRPLGDGIFELRVQAEGNAYRVLYFFFVGRKIVFTHGFTKKTQQTPPREIERAKKYRNAYITKQTTKKETPK